jgi:hypothetical protein
MEEQDYVHIETNKCYTVTAQGLMKTTDGTWVPCYVYDNNEETFVLSKEEFEKEFRYSGKSYRDPCYDI